MILMLLILVKFFYFYSKVNVQKNYIYTVIFSTLSVSIFTIGLKLLSIRTGFEWWAIVYYTISIVMLIDVVYYKHFNQLTTINLIKQIKHLSTVGDSLAVLLDWSMLTLVLDLVIIPFLPEKIIRFIISGIDIKVIFLVFLIFILELLYFNKSMQVVKQDLVLYHGIDILDSIGIEAAQIKKEVDEKELKNYIYKTDKKDKLYGVAKGTNLIVIQVEALQNFLFQKKYRGVEVVPNLKKFAEDKNSFYFDNMFQIIGRGNTSDAEFATLTSLYPPRKAPVYMDFPDRDYYSLPKAFKDIGYTTMIFHGNEKHYYNRNEMYPRLGFDKFFGKEDFKFDEENKIGFGINDEDFLSQTFDYIIEEEQKGPVCAFIITLSSHTPFNLPDKFNSKIAGNEATDTMVGRYLNAINYADKALGMFFEKMEASGLMDRSTVVLYGDHFAISAANTVDASDMANLLDYVYGYSYDDMMNIPLVIRNKNFEHKVFQNTCSQMDILPTLLNLYGIHKSKGVGFGSDIINRPKNICMPSGYLEEGSFFTNDAFVQMDRSGDVKDASAFKKFTHIPIDANKYEETKEKILHEEKLSKYAILFNKITSERIGL